MTCPLAATPRAWTPWIACGLLVLGQGCGLLLDLDPPDEDASSALDASIAYDARFDGALDAATGSCGDGIVDVDAGEQCDEVRARV